MIFLDASAIYALADRDDPNHNQATADFQRMLEDGEEGLVHSYVLVESAALLQRRLGLDIALQFLQESQAFHVHWVDSHDHEEAVELLNERGKRGLSLVDCASFAVMRYHQVDQALAFDPDFEAEGFALYRAPKVQGIVLSAVPAMAWRIGPGTLLRQVLLAKPLTVRDFRQRLAAFAPAHRAGGRVTKSHHRH